MKETVHLDTEKVAMKVSLVSIIANVALSLGKLLAGVLAHSGAMISDAVHSASDVFSTIIVMIGVKLAAKDSDRDHPYGHERLECVAAIILAAVLMVTGLAIGYNGLKTIVSGDYSDIQTPGMLALIAAVVSIIVKEAMFWYTSINAKKIDSSALKADAWHHRSDALSSVGAFIGIGGARLGYPVMDALASVVICIFIAKAALEIFVDAINKMVDKAVDHQTEEQLRACVLAQEGVLGIDEFRTRVFGNKIYVDVDILAEGNLTLVEGHEIAEQVHDAIENHFPKVKHIMVHVNPKECEDGNMCKHKNEE